MKNAKQSSKKRNTNMKKDFKQFFIQQAGKSQVKQGEFQQVQQFQDDKQSNKSSDNEFEQIDEDEQYQGGIKTAQFWNGIKMPSNPPSLSKQPVNWQIRCAMSTGFNSLGRDNIFYLNSKICKAAGCVLIYNEQIYQKNSQKITTISYNPFTQQILTATQGSSPQLFLWKFDQETQTIKWVRRFFVGKKCEDIYAISFFKNNYIIAVEKFTLHKSSNLHVFDKISGKKLSTLKVGKFYDLQLLVGDQRNDQKNQSEEQNENESQDSLSNVENKQRLFFANDEGISELILTQKDNKQIIQLKKLYQSKTLTCLCPFYYQSSKSNQKSSQLQILTGDKQGKISTIFNNKNTQIKVHNGWIFQIKHKKINKKDYFFSLGAIDSQLAILSLQNKKFNILHRIQLSGYGRSIQSENDMLLIGKRDGSYVQFSIQQLISQKQIAKITRKQQLSLKCFQSKEKSRSFIINIPNKQLLDEGKKVYAYGNSGSKMLRFFTIENGQEQVMMKDINDNALRSYPQALDISKSLLAYTYDVEYKQEQSIKSQSFSSMFSKTINNNNNKKQKPFQKSVLVLQNYQNKQLITKKQIKLQNQDKYRCTVIKFSPSGRYLAMGNSEGWVFLYQVKQKNKNEGLSQQYYQFIKCQQKLHKQPIQQLIWSKDQKFIKSVSMSQLYYWQVTKNHNNNASSSSQTTPTTQNNKKNINLQQCKALKLRDTNWIQLSKFSWQVKDIWQKTSIIEQFNRFWSLQYTQMQINESDIKKQISSQKKQIILSSTNEGMLRIYNYPASFNNYQQIKLNNQPFQIIQYLNDDDSFSFLVIIEGIVMVVELSKEEEQEQQEG